MMSMGMDVASVPVMAAMMVPSAVPAIARRATQPDGALAAPRFAGAYFGVWIVVALGIYLFYAPPSHLAAGTLIVCAGLYELTPLKRECRRRCRARVDSGLQFGVYCCGSSIGLMLVLIAVDVMSLPLMGVIAIVVLVQKLCAPRRGLDLTLALAIVAVGVVVAAF